MLRFRFFAAVLVSVLALASSGSRAASPENTLYLDLKDGRVVIELRPDLAPKHVQRIKQLVKEGFYNGLTFHRVINGVHGADRRSERGRDWRIEISESVR